MLSPFEPRHFVHIVHASEPCLAVAGEATGRAGSTAGLAAACDVGHATGTLGRSDLDRSC